MYVTGILKTEPWELAFIWKILLETELVFYYSKQKNYDRLLNIKVLIRMSRMGKKDI